MPADIKERNVDRCATERIANLILQFHLAFCKGIEFCIHAQGAAVDALTVAAIIGQIGFTLDLHAALCGDLGLDDRIEEFHAQCDLGSGLHFHAAFQSHRHIHGLLFHILPLLAGFMDKATFVGNLGFQIKAAFQLPFQRGGNVQRIRGTIGGNFLDTICRNAKVGLLIVVKVQNFLAFIHIVLHTAGHEKFIVSGVCNVKMIRTRWVRILRYPISSY